MLKYKTQSFQEKSIDFDDQGRPYYNVDFPIFLLFLRFQFCEIRVL